MSFEPTDPTVDSTPGAERAPISEATPVSPVSPPPPPVKRKKSLLFWGLIGVAAGVVVFLAALALASYGQSASSAGLRGYLPAGWYPMNNPETSGVQAEGKDRSGRSFGF